MLNTSFRVSSANYLIMLGRVILYIVMIFCSNVSAMELLELENLVKESSNEIQGQRFRQDQAETQYYQQAIDSFLPSVQARLFSQKSRRKADNIFSNFSVDTEWQNGLELAGQYTFLNNSQGYHQFKARQFSYYQQKSQTYNFVMQRLLRLSQLYLDYSRSYYQVEILEQLVSLDERTLKKSQQRYRNGITGKSEVDRAKFRHLDLINEVEIQKTALKNNLNEIQKLVGLDVKINELTPFKLEKSFNFQNYKNISSENIDSYVSQALNQNDALKSLKHAIQNAHYQKSANKMRLAPRLSLNLNYAYFQEHTVDFWADDKQSSFSSLIKLEIPLFESTRNYSDISVAGMTEQIRLTDLRQRQISIRENINTVINQINFFQRKIKRDQEQLSLSKEILATSEKKYSRGSLALRDYLEDQRFYQRQQIQTLNSSIEYLKFYIEFQSLTNSAKNISIHNILMGQSTAQESKTGPKG
jgi:outer membrane protein TolC